MLSYRQIGNILVQHTCSSFVSSRQVYSSRIMELIESLFPESLICSQLSDVKRKETVGDQTNFCLWGQFLWLFLWTPQNKWLTQTLKISINFLWRTWTFLWARLCSLSTSGWIFRFKGGGGRGESMWIVWWSSFSSDLNYKRQSVYLGFWQTY